MNPQITKSPINQAALNKMKQAQIELAIALELFNQTKYYIQRSFDSVAVASAVSINRDCPKYQSIQANLIGAYQELLEGIQIVGVPFENPPLSHLITLGQQFLTEQ